MTITETSPAAALRPASGNDDQRIARALMDRLSARRYEFRSATMSVELLSFLEQHDVTSLEYEMYDPHNMADAADFTMSGFVRRKREVMFVAMLYEFKFGTPMQCLQPHRDDDYLAIAQAADVSLETMIYVFWKWQHQNDDL